MCDICIQMPCHPSCPNAIEAGPLYRCSICGEGIYGGDKYFHDGKREICSACMDDMSVKEILELFGETLITA